MKTYTAAELQNYAVDRKTVGESTRMMLFTNTCNNNCLHCFAGDKSRISFDKEIAKSFIDRYSSVGMLHLSGGEPTIHPDIVEIVVYAKKKGMSVGLMTNGRKLADCDFLNQLINAGINSIVIPFHSHLAEVHNEIVGAKAFDETLMGIHNCIVRGLKTQLMLIVHKKNYQTIDDTARIICSLNPSCISVESLILAGKTIDNLDRMAIRLSETAPYLERALDIFIESGIPINVDSFPLCLFKEKYWDYFLNCINQSFVTNLGYKETSDIVTSGLMQADKCRDCKEKERCPGTWIPYYSVFGEGEFKLL